MSPFQDAELLPKLQVFQHQVALRTAQLNDQIEKELQRAGHELVVTEASAAAKQNATGCVVLGRSGGNANRGVDGNAS